MSLINKDSLGARVKAYTDKGKHANVVGVTGPGAEGAHDDEGESDPKDPWGEVHKHLDALRGALEEPE